MTHANKTQSGPTQTTGETVELSGIAASPGFAIGKAVLVKTIDIEGAGRRIDSSEVDAEIKRFLDARDAASKELVALQEDVETKVGKEQAEIFGAQKLMLEDPGLEEAIVSAIREDLVSAEKAALASCESQAKMLQEIDDPYLAARALDLHDIGRRLVRTLLGVKDCGVPTNIPDNTVLIADDLAPSDTVSLDASKVSAIVLNKGGRTSHTAILARALGIPSVVGTGVATESIAQDDTVAVDGETGDVVVNPNPERLAEFQEKVKSFLDEKRRLEQLRDKEAVTLGGHRVELAANIGGAAEVDLVKNAGADGVGLFRTEFLFIDRETMPTEEEQFAVYKEVLAGLSPRPIVIRTLDAGGDKYIPYLNIPEEDNPFLGLRAIRLCLARKDIFKTQLRALLRASIYGNLRIMFPMVANLEELRSAKAVYEEVRRELQEEGVQVSDSIQVGIMIEVPSAAIAADVLAPECDFFSIGTNDLVQYTMACDRGNAAVSYLSDPFYPAVLRLIKRTIDEGHKHGIWVGMCGEMAGMPPAVPLLVSMGLDELSMAAGSVPRAKEIVRGLTDEDLKTVWDKVSRMSTRDEIKTYLEGLVKGGN